MQGVPFIVAAAVPTELLVAAFLLLVIALVAIAVAAWIFAADQGWIEPLEGYDEEPTPAPAVTSAPPRASAEPISSTRSETGVVQPGRRAPPTPAAPPEGQEPEPPLGREEEVDTATAIVVDPETEDTVPAAGGPRFELVAGGQTDRGRKRPRNEDHFAMMRDEGLFVVADGMGGYAGGLLAARLCCEIIVQRLAEGPREAAIASDLPRGAAELVAAIQEANRVIHARGLEEPGLEGMGTTVVCARFVPDEGRLYLGHVGDSRVYRVRDGRIRQLTIDHTMARFGVRGRAASALSRAVGVGPGVHVDVILAEPRPDDLYLLCSDGLTKMVRNPETLRRALAEASSPEQAVRALVDLANRAGGKDNITVVVVGVGQPPAGLRPKVEGRDRSRLEA